MPAISLQALGIDFQLLSASDTCKSYRSLIVENHRPQILHMFTSAEAQAAGKAPCELCRQTGRTGPCKADGDLGLEVDLLVSGSPCDPFSTQRTKRFADGSVVEHTDFSVTMETVLHGFCRKNAFSTFHVASTSISSAPDPYHQGM